MFAPAANDFHQVWFDTNRSIVDVFTAAGYPTPQTPIAYRTVTE